MARLELKNISTRTKNDLKILAKSEGKTLANVVEPLIKDYIRDTHVRRQIRTFRENYRAWD